MYGYHGASGASFSKLFKQKRMGELCNKINVNRADLLKFTIENIIKKEFFGRLVTIWEQGYHGNRTG